ncbi:hypothetical protein SKAU_G00133660 [Synaphobranchus kaupii]|uniref:RING-type E3 ubiquitin transferase n=1 Tax=Synaphobranchus kaupii TaxID=118154 RepID=A0A9Q1J3Q9_SYNKA|nr:hypothetical protein SKAU_G00133660 [Synaphobranchus kaupii]
MEREGRTVIVCGVPKDIEEKRLTDKLCIHFLRKRHGGGEISSITLPKSTPGCAHITFEDSEVARRVIQYEKHVLSVDDKKFELTVSLFCKEVDPDEVFLRIAVTVDYSRLPLGKVAVSSLRQSFPDVHFSFMSQEDLCNIKGRYSEVQTLITHLLSLIDPQASAATQQPEGTADRVDALSASGPVDISASGPAYHSKSSERQMDTGYAGQAFTQDLKSLTKSHHYDQALDDNKEGEDVAGSLSQGAPLEEYFLVMDSDIYRYLREHCGEQYQHILSQHRVEVVDLCGPDITTVYLQVEAGYPGQEVKRLQRVHEELGKLYQQNEAQLRKEQLSKEGISTEGLQQAFKALRQRLPKILLSNDEMNIYIVGSGSDVSEAKQFLLDMQGTEGGSMLGRTDYTSPLVDNESDSLFLPSTSASTAATLSSIIDVRETDTVHKPIRKHKWEAGKEYKIAAKFMEAGSKATGNNEMGFVTGDTTAPGDKLKDLLFATSKKTSDSGCRLGSGPVLGSGSLGVDLREYSLRDNQGLNQTENDLLFGRSSPHYTTSKEGKHISNVVPTSAVLPNKPMQLSNMQNAVYKMDLFGNRVAQTSEIPPSGLTTESKLKRVNSFSGQVRPTQDLKDSTTPGASQGKTNRARTSSFSNSIADTPEVYSVEVVVRPTVWYYMMDCYSTEIENLTTGLNLKECKSGGTITLIGADSPTVGLCQRELRNLIAKVTTDFCTQQLSLSTLGVTNPNDETIKLSCIELQNKFEKIKILPMITSVKSIIIMGPNQLCGQVVSKLMEVFHNGTQREKEMEENLDGSSPTSLLLENISQMPTDNMKGLETASGAHNLLKEDIIQTTGLISVDSPQYSRDTQMDRELESSSRGRDNHQEKDSSQREKKHDFGMMKEGWSQSAEHKDPVFKNKLGLECRENLESDTSLTQPTVEGRRVNVPKDSGSASLPNLAYTNENAVVPNRERIQRPPNFTTHERHIPPGLDGLESPERKDPKDQHAAVSGKIPGKKKTQEDSQSCLCGASRGSISRMACGNAYCPQCLCDHASCKVCPKAKDVKGIKGTMNFTELSMGLAGHIRDTTVKLTYNIPDGIQGEGHPNPGAPFQGGVFEAFLPLNKQTHKLVPLLKRAFNEGLTFTVIEGDMGGRVTWGSIPHKTRMNGGKPANGYPDSTFINHLTGALKLLDIEEDRDTAKVQDKIKS